MTKTSDNNINLIKSSFEFQLQELLISIKNRAIEQFNYNINTNVPAKIHTLDECPESAIKTGIIGGINKMYGWDCYKAIEISAEILQDVNCHSEAKILFDLIKE